MDLPFAVLLTVIQGPQSNNQGKRKKKKKMVPVFLFTVRGY